MRIITKGTPLIVLDWDYHTFDLLESDGSIIAVYENDLPNNIFIQGSISPGLSIDKTLYTRFDENPFNFRKV